MKKNHLEKEFPEKNISVRRTQEELCEAEESGAMFEVKDIPVKEGVESGIKRWIVPKLAEVQNAS